MTIRRARHVHQYFVKGVTLAPGKGVWVEDLKPVIPRLGLTEILIQHTSEPTDAGCPQIVAYYSACKKGKRFLNEHNITSEAI